MITPILSQTAGSNTYLVSGRLAAVIDPGFSGERVLLKTRELHIVHYLLINTHAHFDHVKDNNFLMENGARGLQAHVFDAESLEGGDGAYTLDYLFGERMPNVKVDTKLEDADVIDLGSLKLEVLHTPGHTKGSICLYEPESKTLFSGDTLFKDGVGRTDFPGGSASELKKSLKRLLRLRDERGVNVFYPGHGPPGLGGDIERVYDIYFN